jgi:hypothetical protein
LEVVPGCLKYLTNEFGTSTQGWTVINIPGNGLNSLYGTDTAREEEETFQEYLGFSSNSWWRPYRVGLKKGLAYSRYGSIIPK